MIPSQQRSPTPPGGPLTSLLFDHVRALTPEEGGLRDGEGIVIGISGGGDSLALLDLLHRLAPERSLRLVAAHLDHGLRAERAADQQLCARACAERGIGLVTVHADVAARAGRSGAGIEAAGRNARLALFEAVRRRHGLDRIATGHQLDDHIETIALWTLRGTGLRGLGGIAPARGRFVRPLRAVSRQTLRRYLAERGLTWAEDASNSDPARTRNWLRNNVLTTIDRALCEAGHTIDWRGQIDALSRRAAQERAALEELVAERLRACTLEQQPARLTLARQAFVQASPALRFQLLRAAVAAVQVPGPHQKWNEERYRGVLFFIEQARPGQRWPLAGGGWLEIERDRLILSAHASEHEGKEGFEPRPDPVPPALRCELLPALAPGFSLEEPNTAWFDAARVRPPFNMRSIRPGDRMQPFGMAGHKKISTLLAERSVPRGRRNHQWVVSDTDRILWVVGVTTCDRARVDATTQSVWRVWIDPPAVPVEGRTP